MTEKLKDPPSQDITLEFVSGVDAHQADTVRTVIQPSGWVTVDYVDGVTVWYPMQAFNRIVRKPL